MSKEERSRFVVSILGLGLFGVWSIPHLFAPNLLAPFYGLSIGLQVCIVLALTHVRHWLVALFRIRYWWPLYGILRMFSEPIWSLCNVLIEPFFEALAFQGTLTYLLSQLGWPVWVVVTAQAIIYATYQSVLHDFPAQARHQRYFGEYIWSLYKGLLGGFLFGSVYALFGNLWLVFLSRAFYNGIVELFEFTVAVVEVEVGSDKARVYIVNCYGESSAVVKKQDGRLGSCLPPKLDAEKGRWVFDLQEARNIAERCKRRCWSRVKEYAAA